jgi:Negative regulator of sigma F
MAAELVAGCDIVDFELDRHFGSGRSRLSAEAQQHLEHCEGCRKLYDHLFSDVASRQGSPATVCARIEASIGRTLRPVSPLPSLYKRAGLFLALFVFISLFKIAMLGPAGFSEMPSSQVIANIAAVLAGGLLLSLSLAAQMTPGTLHRFPTSGAATLLAAAFLLGAALLTPWSAEEVFLAEGWPCFRAGAFMAVPVAFVYWLLVRRGAPLSALVLGGTLGAIAGLLGASVLQFTCTRHDAGHLLVWHGGVVLVSTLLGVLIAATLRRLDFGRP